MIHAKEFYMIRHGESTYNARNIYAGSTDIPLTEQGKNQADLARQDFESLPDKPTVIIHSGLERARHTAQIVNKNTDIPMIENAAFNEQSFGVWEGKPWEEVRRDLRDNTDPPNGETHLEFHSRIKKALNETLPHHEKSLIVCHGGVFRAFQMLHGQSYQPVANCAFYQFSPAENETFPWIVKDVSNPE